MIVLTPEKPSAAARKTAVEALSARQASMNILTVMAVGERPVGGKGTRAAMTVGWWRNERNRGDEEAPTFSKWDRSSGDN